MDKLRKILIGRCGIPTCSCGGSWLPVFDAAFVLKNPELAAALLNHAFYQAIAAEKKIESSGR